MDKFGEGLSIRKYQEKDCLAIEAMLISFMEYLAEIEKRDLCRPYLSSEGAKKYLAQLLQDVEKREGGFLVAEFSDRPVGFICFIIDRHEDNILYSLAHKPGAHGWIGIVYVAQEYRGRGIASQLMDRAEQHFKEHGCVASKLLVMADNELAVSRYDHMGYLTKDLEMSKDL